MKTNAIQLAVTACSLGTDLRAAPRLARIMGFAGMQFEAFSSPIDLLDLSITGRREFLRMLAAQAQQCVGLRAELGVKGLAPGADVDRVLSQLDKVLEAASALGAPLVCLDIGSVPAPQRVSAPRPKVTADQAGLILLPTSMAVAEPPVLADPPPDPAFVAQVDMALAELGRLADRYSVIVALRSGLSSFAALHRALATAGCSWFGIDLDPVALLQDEWDADEFFSRLGPSVRHVRGRDAEAGANRRTRPANIGSGNTDWPALLANLDATGYRGWISVDPIDIMDRAKAAEAGAKKLSGMIGE